MKRGWIPQLVALLAVAAVGIAAAPRAPAAPDYVAEAEAARSFPWHARIDYARRWARQRRGVVGFAVTNEQGRVLGGWRVNQTFKSASVVKAMMMVCYLNSPQVRDRDLRSSDRHMLSPMIRWSSDAAANRVWSHISTRCLYRLASRARMRNFSTQGIWGLTRITPAGTARLFFKIDRLTVARHRQYARRLLGSIVREQRWGIARTVPVGFRIYFKGGFVGPPGGRVENQGALLQRGPRRLGIAVLTNDDPSHAYGTRTEYGIAHILLRGYR